MTERKTIVGVDEAGYGPNLGPLVVAASVWTVDQSLSEAQLCEQLEPFFKPRAWKEGCKHTPLGDSKKLYSRASGLDTLEVGLLTMARLCGLKISTASGQLSLDGFLAGANGRMASGGGPLPPWYDRASQLEVPRNGELLDTIETMAAQRREDLSKLGIDLVGLAAVVTPEPSFNATLQATGSKGQLLSQSTLGLVADLLNGIEGPVEVYCDRQGGRKNYLPVLMDAMPDSWFIQTAVTSARCSYITSESPSCEIHFSVGGDSFPPAGLASMLAKYLRERYMDGFNQYWREHVPDIKPTAGYPQDAKRFAAEVGPLAESLELGRERWWREK